MKRGALLMALALGAAAAGCGGGSGPLVTSEYDECLTWMRAVGKGTTAVSAAQRRPLKEAGYEPGRWAVADRGDPPRNVAIAICQYAYVWDRVGADGELSGATLASIAVCSQDEEGCSHPDLVRRVRADERFRALDPAAQRLLTAIARDGVDLAGTFAPPSDLDAAAAAERARAAGLLRKGPWRQLAVGGASCESGEPDCDVVYQFDPRLVPGIERLHQEFV